MSNLKIDVYSIMNDEAVLVPYFLRHYEMFAENIYVWDDDSQDGTHELLAAHPKVKFLPLEKYGDRNDYWVESVFPQYKEHSRGKADWVMIADADEFIVHRRLRAKLEQMKAEGVGMALCQGWCMVSENPPTGNGLIYQEIRRGVPDRWATKWSIFDPAIDVRFQKGRHHFPAYLTPGVKCQKYANFRILHYRYLGEEWIKERDARNMRRLVLAGHPPTTTAKRNLPDGSHGVPLVWWREALKKAQVIV